MFLEEKISFAKIGEMRQKMLQIIWDVLDYLFHFCYVKLQITICFILSKITCLEDLSVMLRPSKSISSSFSLDRSSISKTWKSCNFQKDSKRPSIKIANRLVFELCCVIKKKSLKYRSNNFSDNLIDLIKFVFYFLS